VAEEAAAFRLPKRYKRRFTEEMNRAEERLWKSPGWAAAMPSPQDILDKIVADEKKEQAKDARH
jgi:hypothetical protein